jgi:uncharacterized membrane protein (UPF0127 family)
MKIAERVVMVSILLFLIGGSSWIYLAVRSEQTALLQAVAEGEFEIPLATSTPRIVEEDWQIIYPDTVPIVIGTTSVLASVADSLPERIQGLSDTPFLPVNVVKLFVFGAWGEHAIWMKNMQYSLDILWADKEGNIVHIEENISPDSFPESFGSPRLAWYVIEANAGFVADNNIKLGDKVFLQTE